MSPSDMSPSPFDLVAAAMARLATSPELADRYKYRELSERFVALAVRFGVLDSDERHDVEATYQRSRRWWFELSQCEHLRVGGVADEHRS